MGHLARDPEIKSTKKGHKITSFTVVTNREWIEQDGTRKELADFHKVIAWNKLGEIAGEYLKKGSAIYLEGQLINRNYEDNKKQKHYITEIIADKINFVSCKKSKETDNNNVELVEVEQ